MQYNKYADLLYDIINFSSPKNWFPTCYALSPNMRLDRMQCHRFDGKPTICFNIRYKSPRLHCNVSIPTSIRNSTPTPIPITNATLILGMKFTHILPYIVSIYTSNDIPVILALAMEVDLVGGEGEREAEVPRERSKRIPM